MFPRRRTDQVYATLQQVQRRITEQAGQPQTASTPAGMAPPGPRGTPGPLPIIRPGPQVPPPSEAPPAPPLLPPGVGAHQRYTVVMSGTLASLLVVCWFASIAATVLVMLRWNRPATPEQAPAPEAAISAPPALAPVRGHKLLVMNAADTPDARARLARERDFLNGVANNNAKQGWRPWFEIETPANGQIQLVFAPQGVDKAAWVDFVAQLAKRHPSAAWVEVR